MNIPPAVTKTVIDQFGAFALSERLWADVKQFVQDVDGETDLTGSQKKDRVIADLRVVFTDTAQWILETAVQVALLYIRVGA